eukprot:CAMPEP_0119120306 /NCGR_PEP_ID=MMETSP1310-20130426/1401_1 /TAXON_ID=464262 /ORGANISM="Genus nov. species nov., Strain RCC2339" /LENGTH=272 /DNA_ID=CAMNT_0007109777 /DNA_START=31 /DNA_END=849 /DNA_ORIENTATION=-
MPCPTWTSCRIESGNYEISAPVPTSLSSAPREAEGLAARAAVRPAAVGREALGVLVEADSHGAALHLFLVHAVDRGLGLLRAGEPDGTEASGAAVRVGDDVGALHLAEPFEEGLQLLPLHAPRQVVDHHLQPGALGLAVLVVLQRLAVGADPRPAAAAAAAAPSAAAAPDGRPTRLALDELAAGAGHVDGLGAALVVGFDGELHLLAVRQAAEVFSMDRGLVDEEVVATLVGGDKAEALEGLNHLTFPERFAVMARPRTARAPAQGPAPDSL